jgi:hypothetical protein
MAVIAVSLALGVLSLFLIHPTYRATSSVEIDDQAQKVLGTEDQPTTTNQDPDRLLQTQIDILKSRALAERVADGLNLAGDDRFLKAEGIKPKEPIRHEQVIQALRDNLGATLPRDSRVVPIQFDSASPALAATIANSYADNLIAGNLQRHYDTSTYSKDFLQNQLNLTKTRLEQSERALLDYARSVGIVDPSAGGGDPNDANNNAPRTLATGAKHSLDEPARRSCEPGDSADGAEALRARSSVPGGSRAPKARSSGGSAGACRDQCARPPNQRTCPLDQELDPQSVSDCAGAGRRTRRNGQSAQGRDPCRAVAGNPLQYP